MDAYPSNSQVEARAIASVIPNMGLRCSRCKEMKAESEFHVRRDKKLRKRRRQYYCRECTREYEKVDRVLKSVKQREKRDGVT